MSADLSYFNTGMFSGFIANTPAGEDAWRELAKQSEGSGKFLTQHMAGIIRQLRAAGYSVAKAKPIKAGEIDELLAALGAEVLA
jgi:hypothetical protein